MSFRPIADDWMLARSKVKYFGSYPSGFLQRARDMLAVTSHDQVLHVCSGRVWDYRCGPSCKGYSDTHRHGLGPLDVTMDLDEELKPTIVGDAGKLAHYQRAFSEHPQIQAVLADPPYGGYWICRRCTTAGQEQYRHGTGPAGKITKIRKILRQARVNAELRGYAAIVLSALQVLAIWVKQKGRCAACRDPIAFAGRAAAQLDHDHVTGRVRGFLCRTCNIAEGFLKSYSPAKFRRFCAYRRRCHRK